MHSPQQENQEIQVAEEVSTVSFELAIIDEKEPVKLTPALIRQKSKALTDLKIISIFDDAGYKAVKAATQKAIKTRTAIEKKEKEVLKDIKTRHATEIKEVTDYTAELYIACREAQTDLESKTTAIDNEKAIAAKKINDDLKEKTEGRENKMYELGLSWNGQAFVGPGTTIPKQYLFDLTDEKYNTLITEIEALQLEQAVTGDVKAAPVNVASMIDGQHANFISSGGYSGSPYSPNNTSQKGIAVLFDNIVYERMINGYAFILTQGKIQEEIKGQLVFNDRIKESGIYAQIIELR